MLAKQRNSCIQLWSERLLAPASAVAEMSWGQAPASQEPWVEQNALWIHTQTNKWQLMGRNETEANRQKQKQKQKHSKNGCLSLDWWDAMETICGICINIYIYIYVRMDHGFLRFKVGLRDANGRRSPRTNQIQDPQVCWHSIYELCSMSCDWAHKYLVAPQSM